MPKSFPFWSLIAYSSTVLCIENTVRYDTYKREGFLDPVRDSWDQGSEPLTESNQVNGCFIIG